MRERGPRTHRVRPGRPESVRHGPPSSSSARTNGWQALAIIALIAATAGWTVAILLATRSEPVAVASPIASEEVDPGFSDEATVPPVADTHDAPDLEALVPTEVEGTPLQIQSWTGDTILTDDAWSLSVTDFLTRAGKTAQDLRVAQAYDATQALDASVGVYEVAGVEPTAIRDALVEAWKVDFPGMTVSTVTIGDKEVVKCEFGDDTQDSYLFIRDDVVFDIETTDEEIAKAALAALPPPGARPSKPAGSPASPSPS